MLLILRNRIIGCGAGRQLQSLSLCAYWPKSQRLLRSDPYRVIGRPAPIPSLGTGAHSGSSRVRAASIVTITAPQSSRQSWTRARSSVRRNAAAHRPAPLPASRPCGCPKPLHTSCDVQILVEEAADAVVSLDLAYLGWRAVGEWA